MTTDNTQVGRNEPCPCGSTKKYKRCCGKDAAPKLGAPLDMAKRLERMNLGGAKGGAAGEGPGSGANPMAGFDPSQLD
ncbi:MAG: SEC-C domain-containing protein, partial [Bdellovibrionales bacterium]|nr:SEC-C domain-containing protein [Bdellovibrionales bacterium]